MSSMQVPADRSDAASFRPIFTRASLVLLVALLLGETTINYIDRQVVSVLAPVLRAEFERVVPPAQPLSSYPAWQPFPGLCLRCVISRSTSQ